MTPREAYEKYRDYYKNNQWEWDDVQNFLKKNWIDYEEYDYNEFIDMVETDDRFYEKWGNNCGVELTLEERFQIWENRTKKNVLDDFPIGQLTEPQYGEILTNLGIPKRKIILAEPK